MNKEMLEAIKGLSKCVEILSKNASAADLAKIQQEHAKAKVQIDEADKLCNKSPMPKRIS